VEETDVHTFSPTMAAADGEADVEKILGGDMTSAAATAGMSTKLDDVRHGRCWSPLCLHLV